MYRSLLIRLHSWMLRITSAQTTLNLRHEESLRTNSILCSSTACPLGQRCWPIAQTLHDLGKYTEPWMLPDFSSTVSSQSDPPQIVSSLTVIPKPSSIFIMHPESESAHRQSWFWFVSPPLLPAWWLDWLPTPAALGNGIGKKLKQNSKGQINEIKLKKEWKRN